MKKNYLYVALAAMMAGCLASCSDDDSPEIPDPDFPKNSNGVFILNQGSYYSNIEGMLSLIDYGKGEIFNNIFSKTNNRSLGNTPQCAVAYGSRIYIGVYGSQTIEVIDRNTYKSLQQIKLENSSEGKSPRSMVAHGGKVYVSMYEGYLARLDTLTLNIDASVKVGPNPENIAIYKDRIYVPNSDGMNYLEGYGTTASIVSMNPFQVENTITVPLNPTEFFTNGQKLFLKAMGNYGDVDAAVYEIKDDYSYSEIGKATISTVNGNTVYLINAPYNSKEITYSKYDITSQKTTSINISNIDSPSGLGVDPQSGYIFISSYPMDNGYASYSLPGYVCEFDANGNFKKKYPIGAGTAFIFFNMK